jgi:FKBP-type peptidyl-prolyl cis-trans isomerase SlyD
MKTGKVTLFVATAIFIMAIVLPFSSWAASRAKKGVAVSAGKTVKVNYTVTVDGKVVDSSKGREPLTFKAGEGQIIPGFEKAVIGMKAGEKKSFKVSPEEGYGKEDPSAIQNVPKDRLPKGIEPKAGMTLQARTKDGRQIPAKIMEVKKDVVVINLNHPLAGKTLNFDVEVIDVK